MVETRQTHAARRSVGRTPPDAEHVTVPLDAMASQTRRIEKTSAFTRCEFPENGRPLMSPEAGTEAGPGGIENMA